MGIPAYFKCIAKDHPEIIKNKIENNTVGNLYIDFNSIIHRCAGNIIAHDKLINDNELQIQIIKQSISYVLKIANICRPELKIFISVDGACPRAKMVQQRKRRYISSLRHDIIKDNINYQKENNTNWNSNIVTPGTNFMKKMDDFLKKEFDESDKFIVSPSNSFGEGEHKLFEYLKNNPYEQESNMVDIIYGLDADLIMLSLLQKSNIMLLREKPAFNNLDIYQTTSTNNIEDEFLFLDVTQLKNSLISHYAQKYNYLSINRENFISDYVILCSLLGNDFLPPLSYTKIKDKSLDSIIHIYFNFILKYDTYLVDQNGNIDFNCIFFIFKELSQNEDETMKLTFDEYHNKRFYDNSKQLNDYKLCLYKFDNFGTFNKTAKNKINPYSPGWRINYYHCLFHTKSSVSNICENYLQGLQWIADYYLKINTYVFNWYYPFAYSPTILDLTNYLTISKCLPTPSSSINNELYIEILNNNFMQLLMVLPPSSKYMVQENNIALNIMENIECNCVHYYPHLFEISTFLKQYIWECSPVLPDIDILHLYKCAKKIENTIKYTKKN